MCYLLLIGLVLKKPYLLRLQKQTKQGFGLKNKEKPEPKSVFDRHYIFYGELHNTGTNIDNAIRLCILGTALELAKVKLLNLIRFAHSSGRFTTP